MQSYIFDTSFIYIRKSATCFSTKISAREDEYLRACNSHLQDRDLWRYSYRYPQFLENWMFSFCHFSTPLLLKSVIPKAWITWVSYSWCAPPSKTDIVLLWCWAFLTKFNVYDSQPLATYVSRESWQLLVSTALHYLQCRSELFDSCQSPTQLTKKGWNSARCERTVSAVTEPRIPDWYDYVCNPAAKIRWLSLFLGTTSNSVNSMC